MVGIFKFIRKFKCDELDWHKPKLFDLGGRVYTIECPDSFGARCKYCGRRIDLDSQGNWFSLHEH